MADPCSWLPALVLFNGDWNEYVEIIYGHFRTDFIEHAPKLRGKPCWIHRKPLSEGKEPTFWHITSEGEVEAERTPDLRRCERIRWPRPLIEGVPHSRINFWRVRRRKKWRLNIAPIDFSYLVSVAELKQSVLLVTAFWVEMEHQRNKLRAEWQKAKV